MKNSASSLFLNAAISFCTFILISPSFAQSVKTDLGVYPEPPPSTIPASGGTFTDPVFGTTLLRVTDSLDGADNHQSYSYWPSFNKTSSILYISSVGGFPMLYDFNPNTLSISNKRALFPANPAGDGTPNAEDAIWSGIQPNHMLCHTSQKIYDYNVSNNQYSLIHDFSSTYPNIFLWQMSRSMNDSTFGFTYKDNGSYAVVGYLAYQLVNNTTDTAHLPTLDEVQVDKTGTFLVIKTGNSGSGIVKVQVLNLLNHQLTNLIDNAPDFAPGHSDNGSGTILGYDNWNNRYTYRTAANPHVFYSVIDYNNDWTLGTHVSMLADDESTVLISSFVADTNLHPSGVFVDEVYEVSTDGAQSVRRFCHTHSDFLHQSSNNSYWSMPRGNISRDGKFATFTSNWGSITRRDVFVLKIPPAGPTSVNENTPGRIKIYPNPATNFLILESLSEEENLTVIFRDAYGRIFREQKLASSKTIVETGSWKPGFYSYVVFQKDVQLFSGKLSIVK